MEEATLKINQQYGLAKVSSAQNIDGIRDNLVSMREGIEKSHPDWMGDANLLAVFGEAFGEVHMLEEAVEFYDRAVKNGKSTAAIKAIEQSANLTIRLAAREYEESGRYSKAAGRIKEKIRTMSQLMGTIGETPERWSITGGGYKRLALISSGKDSKACNAALADMEAAYRKAAAMDGSSYPLTNALSATVVRAPAAPPASHP